ncbi:hypothetical protein B0T17DRAFT_612246 [Bombardia bombarda]|uniref:Aldehyde dehydrogenase domain-containing protein n=1 Tax=Bombardia bombarda TaxID=252184 RepID=A0AA39XJX2_9PEZI|nr:hypothetical protein B0T17DRAFT_612246 [Bombardia bombarda]
MALDRLEAAAIDGRTENIRYRQDQLQSLHRALVEHAHLIYNALSSGSDNGRDAGNLKSSFSNESEAEYYLTMEAVRYFYKGLDFDAELENEYKIVKKNEDNHDRRAGFGVVVIRPTTHTRLYSVVVPVAAAVAGGNCVVLELEKQDSRNRVDEVLWAVLPKALDVNTFCILTDKISKGSITETAVLVDQTGEGWLPQIQRHQLVSPASSRTVAFVDRTADIETAAKAIVLARCSFGGSSPYAPDLVVVNEFVKTDFVDACTRAAGVLLPRGEGKEELEDVAKIIKDAEEKGEVGTGYGGENAFTMVHILDRNTALMKMKISGYFLPIMSCTGLVDAVFGTEFENPLLAGYFFAEPGAAKYMSQHLRCRVSCINQIPIHLLVGPAAPISNTAPPDYLYRYSKNMFSMPRPQYAEPLPAVFKPAEELLLLQPRATDDTEQPLLVLAKKSARKLATRPLKPTGQPITNDGVGFFESGLFLAGGITLTVVVAAVGWTSWALGRRGWEFVGRLRGE